MWKANTVDVFAISSHHAFIERPLTTFAVKYHLKGSCGQYRWLTSCLDVACAHYKGALSMDIGSNLWDTLYGCENIYLSQSIQGPYKTVGSFSWSFWSYSNFKSLKSGESNSTIFSANILISIIYIIILCSFISSTLYWYACLLICDVMVNLMG